MIDKCEMKTLVFGASLKPERYSHKAIVTLLDYDYPVVAIGGREGTVDGIMIMKGHPEIDGLHTLTLYMGEQGQQIHEDYLLSLNPKRIIFNPGAENINLYLKAKEKGIDVINACTLVMLRTSQF